MILKTGDKVRVAVAPVNDRRMHNRRGTVVGVHSGRAYVRWDATDPGETSFLADRTNQEMFPYQLEVISSAVVCEND